VADQRLAIDLLINSACRYTFLQSYISLLHQGFGKIVLSFFKEPGELFRYVLGESTI
jgi:hypothetical protein